MHPSRTLMSRVSLPFLEHIQLLQGSLLCLQILTCHCRIYACIHKHINTNVSELGFAPGIPNNDLHMREGHVFPLPESVLRENLCHWTFLQVQHASLCRLLEQLLPLHCQSILVMASERLQAFAFEW